MANSKGITDFTRISCPSQVNDVLRGQQSGVREPVCRPWQTNAAFLARLPGRDTIPATFAPSLAARVGTDIRERNINVALGFVILGMIIGAAGAAACVISGAGLLYALLIYAGIGAATVLGVVLLQAAVYAASGAFGAQPHHS